MSGSYGQGFMDEVFGPAPGRPDHPDFRKMVNSVLKLDTRMDGGGDFEGTVKQYVDKRSVVYMAEQRALRARLQHNLPEAFQILLTAVWLDGFIIGSDFTDPKGPPPT